MNQSRPAADTSRARHPSQMPQTTSTPSRDARPGEATDEGTDDMTHVLVVDDDPIVRRLVRVTLADAGYDVDVASDGEEALKMACDAPPDAIVLDLEMPRLDGRAAFHEMRERGVQSPVLILSSNGAQSAQRELCAEESLDKPFDPLELLRRVDRLLHSWPSDGAAPAVS